MIKITLDRVALRSLVEKDPKFEFELKGAVLSEIGLRYFEKDIRRIVATAEPDMFKKALAALQNDNDGVLLVKRALQESIEQRTGSWGERVSINDKTRALIEEQVNLVKNRAIDKAVADISNEIAEKVKMRLEELNVDDRINKRVDRLTEEYIATKTKELFDRRLADLAKPR